ncbi:MAG: hypothetical protein ACLRQF_01370 [Thomasclavelia ramosa]
MLGSFLKSASINKTFAYFVAYIIAKFNDVVLFDSLGIEDVTLIALTFLPTVEYSMFVLMWRYTSLKSIFPCFYLASNQICVFFTLFLFFLNIYFLLLNQGNLDILRTFINSGACPLIMARGLSYMSLVKSSA